LSTPMIGNIGTEPGVGELDDLRYCDAAAIAKVAAENRDYVKGVKVRFGKGLSNDGKNEPAALARARAFTSARAANSSTVSPRCSWVCSISC